MEGLMDYWDSLVGNNKEELKVEKREASLREPVVNEHISTIIKAHSARLGVDYKTAIDNALKFSTYVGLVENSGKTYGRNVPEKGKEASSASGLYQFLTDDEMGQSAWQTALNRTKKYTGQQDWISKSYEYGKDGVELTTRNQQTAVFLADILEKKHSDKYMKGILEGDRSNWAAAYKELHYRGKTTPAAMKNAEEVYKQEVESTEWQYTGD